MLCLTRLVMGGNGAGWEFRAFEPRFQGTGRVSVLLKICPSIRGVLIELCCFGGLGHHNVYGVYVG